jgi:hypothetical protein
MLGVPIKKPVAGKIITLFFDPSSGYKRKTERLARSILLRLDSEMEGI